MILVTMRRVNGLATLNRAIARGGGTSTTIAAEHRLVQAATMSTCSNANSQWFSQKIANHFGISSPSVAGTMFFSVAASSLAQEVQAKELPPAEKFLPKDVVLYQYEACPFCNKVKGNFVLSQSQYF